MNKTLKIIMIITVSLIFGYLVYFFVTVAKYSYNIDMDNYKEHIWLFKDSTRSDIDTIYNIGFSRDRDIFCSYIYKHIYDIGIWEFKDLSKIKLSEISINQNVSINNLRYKKLEVLNKGGSPEITVRLNFSFNNMMNINIDKYSKIEKEFKSDIYKGFLGTLNRLSLSNQNSEQLVLINFSDNQKPSLVLCYKGHQSFYLIIIRSDKTMDENIIKIFNFK